MSDQSVRQQARLAAREGQRRMRADRAARDKRLGDLGAQVAVALAERDTAVGSFEQRAGKLLERMIEQEAISLAEAVDWCGGVVSRREVTRLRRLAGARGAVGGDRGSGPAAAATEGPD